MTTSTTLRTYAEFAAARGELIIVDPAAVLALLARLDALADALRPALEAEVPTPVTVQVWAGRVVVVAEDAKTWLVEAGHKDYESSHRDAALVASLINALPAVRAALGEE
jgi:hypothetical protein